MPGFLSQTLLWNCVEQNGSETERDFGNVWQPAHWETRRAKE